MLGATRSGPTSEVPNCSSNTSNIACAQYIATKVVMSAAEQGRDEYGGNR